MTPTRTFRVFALAVALVAIAACASDPETGPILTFELGGGVIEVETVDGPAAAAERIQRVVMIGDSITKGATAPLQQRFEALGLDTTITAENGKRMVVSTGSNPSGADAAQFLALEQRDFSEEVWVVALGTNDAGQYASTDVIAAAVNEVLASVPDAAALVWVDTYIGIRPDDTDEVNAVVHERVRRRGNAAIAPWSSVAPGDGVLSADSVHPTAAGSDAFAALVADSAAAFIGR